MLSIFIRWKTFVLWSSITFVQYTREVLAYTKMEFMFSYVKQWDTNLANIGIPLRRPIYTINTVTIQYHFLMFRHSNTGYYWNTLMILLISRQKSSWGYDCDKNITFHHNHNYISPLTPIICTKNWNNNNLK